MEPLTGKRDGYRFIRKSASELAVRQTIPVANEVFRDCGAIEGGCYAIFPHSGKLHVRGVERIDAQSAQRFEALRPVVEKLGGRIVNGFFADGEYDVVLILEMPDEASAAALAVAAAGGGHYGPSTLRNSLPPPKELRF